MSPRTAKVLWDILIATVPHRHATLCELLSELERQIRGCGALGLVGALLYRDNYARTIAEKRQALLESSGAEYISFFDDDDMPAPDYVSSILRALEARPDYVGFRVRYVANGAARPLLIEHSLRHPGWSQEDDVLRRDISHLNPIRRELALLGRFSGAEYSEDSRWAAEIRDAGRVRAEAWIDSELYVYRYSSQDNSRIRREPVTGNEIAPVPSWYLDGPWLRVLRTLESC